MPIATEQVHENSPIPIDDLNRIIEKACTSALSEATSYDHASTSSWNTTIINNILKDLVSSSSQGDQPPQYKFAVNSTIIQNAEEPMTRTEQDEEDGGVWVDGGAIEKAGITKRGMHSASGAFWNNQKDGMWSYKYDKAQTKGFDVVINVMWISVI